MPPDLPVLIVTGFLGVGKTTLLNRVLRSPELAGSMVVVNEFGAIGLDHHLMAGSSETVALMASGCLCCALRGDLVDTLEDLARRRADADLPPFGRVFVETSGLADPPPVMQSVMAPALAALGYRLAGVVTLVDAVHGAATLDAEPVGIAQVAAADRIVLTKANMAPDPASLRVVLAGINPGAEIIAGEPADLAALFSLSAAAPRGAARGSAFACHDATIASLCLTSPEAMEPAALEQFLERLVGQFGAGLLRLKGLVRLADAPGRPLVVQGVRHQVYPLARLARWPDADEETRLVLIGRDLDTTGITRLFRAFCGAPGIDMPDRAALLNNPLAL